MMIPQRAQDAEWNVYVKKLADAADKAYQAAEVHDLKQGYAALEERARSELGMIAGNESFYQVVPQKAPVGPPPHDVQRTALAR